MKRALNIFFSLLFLAFAALNINDLDPVVWILAYGSVGILFALAVFGRADRRVSGWLCIALGIWMCTMLPGMMEWLEADMPSIVEEMQATNPYIEEVREFLGLFIAVLALVFLTFSTPREARLG
ncbi:MAG: transmembrane 220 family protein [Flavobacteriales bacterium]|nr:transmembrane 220 family protein [Flavobacteriales bacterium]